MLEDNFLFFLLARDDICSEEDNNFHINDFYMVDVRIVRCKEKNEIQRIQEICNCLNVELRLISPER